MENKDLKRVQCGTPKIDFRSRDPLPFPCYTHISFTHLWFWLLAQGGVCWRGWHVQRDHPRARLEDPDRWRCRSKLSRRNSVSLLPSHRDHSRRSETQTWLLEIKIKGKKMSPVIHGCQKLQSLLFTVLTSAGLFVPGSTDCICFATVGTNDPVTSALHIIVGESHGVTAHHLVTKALSTSIFSKRKEREWLYPVMPIFCVSSLPKAPFQSFASTVY